MELLTPELRKQLRAANRGSGSKAILAKLFNPAGAATWLLTSLDSDDDTLWCVADLGLGFVEYGTVSLSELESIRGPFGLGIERDLYCDLSGLRVEHFLRKDHIDIHAVRSELESATATSDA
jgi:hypothetical protein